MVLFSTEIQRLANAEMQKLKERHNAKRAPDCLDQYTSIKNAIGTYLCIVGTVMRFSEFSITDAKCDAWNLYKALLDRSDFEFKTWDENGKCGTVTTLEDWRKTQIIVQCDLSPSCISSSTQLSSIQTEDFRSHLDRSKESSTSSLEATEFGLHQTHCAPIRLPPAIFFALPQKDRFRPDVDIKNLRQYFYGPFARNKLLYSDVDFEKPIDAKKLLTWLQPHDLTSQQKIPDDFQDQFEDDRWFYPDKFKVENNETKRDPDSDVLHSLTAKRS